MKAIAAMSSNRVIGKNGKIPWNLPGDLKYFKSMTLNQNIVVGYNTYCSLPILEKRNVLILSHRPKSFITEEMSMKWNDKCSSIRIINDLFEIPEDAWICGGQNLYELTSHLWTDLYLTTIKYHFDGDRFFPSFTNMELKSIVEKNEEYKIEHYISKT